MNSKTIKIIIFLISAILILSVILATAGCSKLDIEIFGKKFGGETEDFKSTDDKTINDTRDDTENSTDISTKDDIDSDNKNTNTGDIVTYSTDISELRLYFKEAMECRNQSSYFISEYYLNKIKDDYLVLQDHIFYYMAESLRLQEKYDQAEEYYLKLIKNYPDSIWTETASLEYADMLYIREDYITAENEYEHFRTAFPYSSYMPYCLFQLATCQEMNGKKDLAFGNYKKIWLNYPLSEYSEIASENLNKLAEDSSIEPFVPTANQIYNRGEIFFGIYHYNSALDEFNRILQGDYLNSLSRELHSKTLFKKGMCYFNLRDYSQSKYYLSLSYEKSPLDSVADDSLYYLGRALTNLNLDNDAISYYQKLLQLFPKSNYGDDALYRIGRIYSLKEDFENAASYFQKVSSDYPGGDKLPAALWELGLIQYRSGDYSSAKNTFSNYASSYKGSSLEEKGLFWQAKCCQKLGENDKAAEFYKKIIDLNSYSYYTFASGEMLKEMNKEAQIKEINTQLDPENPQIADIIPDIYDILEEDSYIETGEINHIDKAVELLKLEFFNSASLEIEAGSSEIEENPVRTLEIATLFIKSNNYSNSINIIHKNFKKLKSELNEPYTDYLYYLYYPYGYKEPVLKYSIQNNLDPRFTLAVMRQESLFEPDAGSYAGAQGLMQIMPATGEGIARQIGISNYNTDLLLDPDINIRMGTFYLRQQLDNFSQNQFYCLGAYNGGPGKMSGWISERGDMDIDEFIESVSYEQSREYIKIVMGNYYFYQMLYD
ncbi:MAG: tetratricopeptide repeat protein [Actinobacteria bacterium]|nr:tetratricopeptide repeat protein [Actinomycetota bacterium]